jgi:hypothetical protein
MNSLDISVPNWEDMQIGIPCFVQVWDTETANGYSRNFLITVSDNVYKPQLHRATFHAISGVWEIDPSSLILLWLR